MYRFCFQEGNNETPLKQNLILPLWHHLIFIFQEHHWIFCFLLLFFRLLKVKRKKTHSPSQRLPERRPVTPVSAFECNLDNTGRTFSSALFLLAITLYRSAGNTRTTQPARASGDMIFGCSYYLFFLLKMREIALLGKYCTFYLS